MTIMIHATIVAVYFMRHSDANTIGMRNDQRRSNPHYFIIRLNFLASQHAETPMSIIFDPTKMLKKLAPKAKIKRMVDGKFSLKRTILATMGSDEFPIDKNSVGKVARKTLRGYKNRVKKAAVDAGEKSAGTEEKSTILSQPKQLIQRVQNELVFQIHQGVREKYRGKMARWLPSDADEPRPEHQANYGKTYVIGEGIDGIEPGDEYGCRCGVEILTDETQLDLS